MNFLFFSSKEKYLFASVPGFCAFLRSHTVLINVTIIEGLIGLNETIVIVIKIIRIRRFFSPTASDQNSKNQPNSLTLRKNYRLLIEIRSFVSRCIKATCNTLHSSANVILSAVIYPVFPPSGAAQ